MSGCKTPITIQLDEANKVVIHEFGATVVSWICGGKERLFVSSKAIFNDKKAIRGGIPVVFPNFGPWEHGPQHGFARITMWKHENTTENKGEVVATFTLSNNSETEAMWNYKFSLSYQVSLSMSEGLKCTLSVTNNDTNPFDFTTLLHTYIRVPDIQAATVTNLSGLQYVDKLKGGQEFKEERALVSAVGGSDSVYQSTPGSHEISGCVDGSKVSITKENMPDTVIWNPWVENAKKMGDFGDEEYVDMICVEPGAVSQRVIIQPGEVKRFGQTVRVL